MKNNNQSDHIAEVFAQSQSNSEQIKQLREDFTGFAKDIRDAIEILSTRMSKQGRTDWVALGTWAAVILAFFGPMLYYQRQEISELKTEMHVAVSNLDTKLQRETALALETEREGLKALGQEYTARHSDLIKRVDMIQDLINDQAKSELQELRILRRKGVSHD